MHVLLPADSARASAPLARALWWLQAAILSYGCAPLLWLTQGSRARSRAITCVHGQHVRVRCRFLPSQATENTAVLCWSAALFRPPSSTLPFHTLPCVSVCTFWTPQSQQHACHSRLHYSLPSQTATLRQHALTALARPRREKHVRAPHVPRAGAAPHRGYPDSVASSLGDVCTPCAQALGL